MIDDGIFFLSDVTDYIEGGYINGTHFSEKISIPKIMNKETIKHLRSTTTTLKPIIPLSCASWHDKCKSPFCFTQNVIKLEFSPDSKIKYEIKNGIMDCNCKLTYTIFTHKSFAESILKPIVKQLCYKIADKNRCELGTSVYDGKNADDYMDAFSFAPKK